MQYTVNKSEMTKGSFSFLSDSEGDLYALFYTSLLCTGVELGWLLIYSVQYDYIGNKSVGMTDRSVFMITAEAHM